MPLLSAEVGRPWHDHDSGKEVRGKFKPQPREGVVISDDVLAAELSDLGAARLSKIRYKLEASPEQIDVAPVGNLGHRIWRCQSEWMSKLRNKWAPAEGMHPTQQCNVEGHPAWERALRPRPTKPVRSVEKEESFRWVVEPSDGMLEGTAYSDGSFLDGPIPELARGGWSFG